MAQRGHARHCGGGGAPQLRQAGGLPRREERRRRRRRGCARGRLRRRALRLGQGRHSRQSRRLAAHGGAAPRHRRGAAAAQRRGCRPASPAPRRGACPGPRRRRAVVHAGPPPLADVRLRPSGDRSRHPRAADPADDPRLRCRDHRLGLPGVAGGHGPAPGAREDEDQSGRHSVPGARAQPICASGSTRCWRRSTPPSPKAGPIPPAPKRAAAISARRRSGSGGSWCR